MMTVGTFLRDDNIVMANMQETTRAYGYGRNCGLTLEQIDAMPLWAKKSPSYMFEWISHRFLEDHLAMCRVVDNLNGRVYAVPGDTCEDVAKRDPDLWEDFLAIAS